MDFFDLKKSFKNNSFSIYYIFGEDSCLVSRAAELICDAYAKNKELNYARYDLTKPPQDYLSMLVTSLNSPPFIEGKRVVFAQNLSVTSKDFEGRLLSYFDNPSEDAVLIITAGEKNSVDFKKHKNVCPVDCKKADTSTLIRYISGEFAKAGAQISTAAATRLTELTLRDFYRVKTETEKLISYSLKYGSVGVSQVDECVAADSEYKLWEFADAAALKDFEKAFKILTELQDKGTGTGTLLFRLYSMYKNLFEISVSEKSDAELAASLKMKEYAVKMLRRKAGNYTKKQLRLAVENLADTDARIKNGTLSSSNALVFALARAALV